MEQTAITVHPSSVEELRDAILNPLHSESICTAVRQRTFFHNCPEQSPNPEPLSIEEREYFNERIKAINLINCEVTDADYGSDAYFNKVYTARNSEIIEALDFLVKLGEQGRLNALVDFMREENSPIKNFISTLFVNNISALPTIAAEILELSNFFNHDVKTLLSGSILSVAISRGLGPEELGKRVVHGVISACEAHPEELKEYLRIPRNWKNFVAILESIDSYSPLDQNLVKRLIALCGEHKIRIGIPLETAAQYFQTSQDKVNSAIWNEIARSKKEEYAINRVERLLSVLANPLYAEKAAQRLIEDYKKANFLDTFHNLGTIVERKLSRSLFKLINQDPEKAQNVIAILTESGADAIIRSLVSARNKLADAEEHREFLDLINKDLIKIFNRELCSQHPNHALRYATLLVAENTDLLGRQEVLDVLEVVIKDNSSGWPGHQVTKFINNNPEYAKRLIEVIREEKKTDNKGSLEHIATLLAPAINPDKEKMHFSQRDSFNDYQSKNAFSEHFDTLRALFPVRKVTFSEKTAKVWKWIVGA